MVWQSARESLTIGSILSGITFFYYYLVLNEQHVSG